MFDQIQRQKKYAALFGLFNELPVEEDEIWTKEQIESWVGAVHTMATRSIPQRAEVPQSRIDNAKGKRS